MSTASSSRLSQSDRRTQLLAAARREFVANGYAGARLPAVARACGVTEALVYKYFGSKEELFDAAVTQPLHDLLSQRIEDIRRLPTDPSGAVSLETTRAFFRTLLHTFAESIQPIGVLLFGEPRHARSFYTNHIRPLIDAAAQASEATLGQWPHRDYDIQTAMSAAFGMAFWLAMEDGLTHHANLDATADMLADLLINGIRAR